MSKRINISTGTKWEPLVGYSRAVRVGNTIEVSGTVAVEQDEVHGPGDFYLQTKFILQKIEKAIIEAGGTKNDIVRTRIFVTDITQWEEVGKAHGEMFSEIRPVTTMLEVSALISPELLVEIEATAIVS